MATRDELIAARMSVAEIADHLVVDSLGYLSLEGLVEAVALAPGGHCLACFSGDYPLPTAAGLGKQVFEEAQLQDVATP